MLTISDLQKAFGSRDIFVGADLQIYARDRIGLVGPNGSGKTTLLETIAGEQTPDAGEVRLLKDAVVGYLRQETDALRGRTLIEEMVSSGTPAAALGHRLEMLEHEMADLPPGSERTRIVEEYGRLQDRFSTLGGYSLESEAKRILGGLGFKEEDFGRQTESFSGGWLMRIALAKLLLANPDLLMLDEPTNHLDLDSVIWLERFLRTYDGAVILISHDRDLLNTFASKIVEVRDKRLHAYTGDYEAFVRQRALELDQLEAAARNQSRRVAQLELFINRFRYKKSLASRVQSKVKMLEKMERVEGPSRGRKKMSLIFPAPPRSGRRVVELEDLRFGYPGIQIYEGLDLVIEKGQKVALVGPNGAGKSTLLKLIAGALEPQGGRRRLGHKVELGYFAQHQIEALNLGNLVLQELRESIPPGVDVDARKLLGRFLFSGDSVDKRVAVLSGGEKTRLALAKLLVSPVNLLCLDEPTNHLDMWSRDVLEEALQQYDGTLVLITHDRHLIRNVANHTVEVVKGTVTEFHGDYDYYLSKKAPAEEAPEDPRPRPAATVSSGPKSKEQKRLEAEARAATKGLRERIARTEERLDRLDEELREMEAAFADPGFYSTAEDVAEMTRSYEARKRLRARLEEEWADAVESLELAES